MGRKMIRTRVYSISVVRVGEAKPVRGSANALPRALGTALIVLGTISFAPRASLAQSCRAAERPIASFTIHLQRLTFPETPSIGDEPARRSETTIWPCEGERSPSSRQLDPPPTSASLERPPVNGSERSKLLTTSCAQILARRNRSRLERPPRG